MNKLREAIAKLENKPSLTEKEELLLEMLRQKDGELGFEPDEQEVTAAIRQVIMAHLQKTLKQSASLRDGDDEEDIRSDVVDEAAETIRSVFEEMELHYREYEHQKNVHAFELGLSAKGNTLRAKVYLEAEAEVCRIDAIYPFLADRAFAYPLCEKLAQENYPRRFGALQYDARDGELSYRYSFPITHGLYGDDFRKIFLAVAASANASYDVVRQYATGRFRRDVRAEITCRAQELIIELDQ